MSKEDKKDGKKERKLLEKIEKKLDKIVKRQEEIHARLDRLEASEAQAPADAGVGQADLISFLDQFRAGEALGEASTGAWIDVSDLPCVRGGLRTIQQREGMHARLLEARIKELGGSPAFDLPERIYEQTMQDAGDAEKGDARKVADFVARFPDADAAVAPIHDMIERIQGDDETRFLLQTIAQDERATIEFFVEAAELLGVGEGADEDDD